MRAAFHDLPLAQNKDLIGIADGAEAVSDDKARSPRRQALERLLDQPFGGGIDARGRFVQDENGRVFQQSPRDADALLLADTEFDPALAHAVTCWVAAAINLRAERSVQGAQGAPPKAISYQ